MSHDDKPLTVGIPRETFPGEQRVSVIPDAVGPLIKAGLKVSVESKAGEKAGIPDNAYKNKGSEIVDSRSDLFASSDIILQVRGVGANPEAGRSDIELARPGQTIVGFFEPFTPEKSTRELTGKGVNILAMELMPRITRAQSMDALSSMATIAGYKAVLMAATHLPRMFPMFMTAAGTVAPARVFVIGAGVAGLQAIATAKRLGAVVKGYDIRPAVKEQVESLGARFVELELETDEAEDKGGYAKAMDEEFYRRQRELLTKTLAENDVVITTAAVPGKKAPILITSDMVSKMAPGSVIVDLAAERGGNCELTRPGETIVEKGVTILGPLNIPSTVPYHASQMYAKNISTFLLHLIKEGQLNLNTEDEIVRETLVSKDGQIVHPKIKEIYGLTSEDKTERSEG
jgi:NAD(P) transhydrogenase subunit alpha